jgi:hypothetical protein
MDARRTSKHALEAWLTAWRKRRWQAMADACQVRRRTPKLPVRLSGWFGHKDLISFEILSVEEIAPALDAARVRVVYRFGNQTEVRNLRINLVREDATGMPMPRIAPGGAWGVNEASALREERVA